MGGGAAVGGHAGTSAGAGGEPAIGGTGGTSGAGGAGSGGTSGAGGSAGTSGAGGAGSGGTSGTGGSAGTSGAGGAGGTSGTGGSPGTSGAGGAGGTSGAGGTAGTSGAGGACGTSGTGGSPGTSGAGGAGGTSGAGGTGAAGGSAGTSTGGSSGSAGSAGGGGVCTPNTGTCTRNTGVRCSEDGLGYEPPQDCGNLHGCANGACVSIATGKMGGSSNSPLPIGTNEGRVNEISIRQSRQLLQVQMYLITSSATTVVFVVYVDSNSDGNFELEATVETSTSPHGGARWITGYFDTPFQLEADHSYLIGAWWDQSVSVYEQEGVPHDFSYGSSVGSFELTGAAPPQFPGTVSSNSSYFMNLVTLQ